MIQKNSSNEAKLQNSSHDPKGLMTLLVTAMLLSVLGVTFYGDYQDAQKQDRIVSEIVDLREHIVVVENKLAVEPRHVLQELKGEIDKKTDDRFRGADFNRRMEEFIDANPELRKPAEWQP